MSVNLPIPLSTAEAVSAVEQPRPKTGAPALDHALKAVALFNDRAARLAEAAAPWRLAANPPDARFWAEAWQVEKAALARHGAMQKKWIDDWFHWLDYADRVEGANTTSKLAEHEYNVAAQAVQLAGSQFADMLELAEAVEISWLYLLSQPWRRTGATTPAP